MQDFLSKPYTPENKSYRFDAFSKAGVLEGKKKNHLPAMGWNSWNAFGSGNTEALTKEMAECMLALGLDKLGYEYLVLDDGCYKPERIDGKVSNEEVKFPSGFRALSDYVHEKGLKFGMYNDVGTNLCAGAAVGTCGHEDVDAQCYIDWGVDFLKIDNCYYPWDNATFSNAENARFVFAPNIKAITVKTDDKEVTYDAVKDGVLWGQGAVKSDEGYVSGIGTFDGTGPDCSPVGILSSELHFEVDAPIDGEYEIKVTYATDKVVGTGSWLQVGVNDDIFFDDFLSETESAVSFAESDWIKVKLYKGKNTIRIMNHRRQENTLCSYAALLNGLNKACSEHDVILSLCEWGKTQPHNWGWKIGDSWRILNDISFRVGADGDPGHGDWESDYTTSVCAQYNKAVIMDEFAGLDKGWNDPDMMMIGMDGLDETMCETHMVMWCMMNSPLMLGLDLRRVKKGDWIYNIISNEDLIALNQDSLGIQAKRIYCSGIDTDPSTTYVRDNKRVDVLAKPLSDGSIALSFINLDKENAAGKVEVSKELILSFIGEKMMNRVSLANAKSFKVKNLVSKEEFEVTGDTFSVDGIAPCANVTLKICANV